MKRFNTMKKIFAVVLVAAVSTFAFADGKVALVIGNQNYKNSPLKNPVSDSKDISSLLQKIGFNVNLVQNAGKEEMENALDDFYEKIDTADIGLIYYSGHGVESKGNNYLIPLNDKIQSEEDLKRNAIKLSEILDECNMTECHQLVVILDACRNNPFGSKSRGAGRGLSVVAAPQEIQSIVVYSTAPNKTADDGNGKHSPFTEALLNHLGTANTDFQIIMTEVSMEVSNATNGNQIPYTTTAAYKENIFLNKTSNFQPQTNEVVVINTGNKTGLVVLVFILIAIIIAICVTGFFMFTNAGKNASAVIAQKFQQLKDRKEEKTNEAVQNDFKDTAPVYESSEKTEEVKTQEAPVQKRMVEEVFVKGRFYMSRTPITVKEFNALMDNKVTGKDNQPATEISWIDAVKFCNELSEKERLVPAYRINRDSVELLPYSIGYRLPTEKEWESAAGLNISYTADFENMVWYENNSNGMLPECGLKKPNAYGLCDMAGLVREWCWDNIVSGSKKWKVLKGGAWDSDMSYCNVKVTDRAAPEYKSDNVGFRVVRGLVHEA